MIASSIPVFDRELALQRAGGSQDLAEELFAMLLRDLPDLRQRIESAYTCNNIPALIEVVHKLNGAATYCGVPALKAAAQLSETALKQGQHETYGALQKQLLSEIDRVMANAGTALFS
jgi:two-component system sensor histidine kinase BarA